MSGGDLLSVWWRRFNLLPNFCIQIEAPEVIRINASSVQVVEATAENIEESRRGGRVRALRKAMSDTGFPAK